MRYEITKRLIDILVSAIALIFLSPLFLLIALVVKLDSPGPSIYRGQRVGRDGEMFDIYKFRSMFNDINHTGNPITIQGDARITRFGRLLRRWKLDELPNLFNVLLGDMSLVGPRPESPVFVKYYSPVQRQVLSVRPGITCLSQMRYPNEESILHGTELNETEYLKHMANKLELDLLYVCTLSLLGDILILICTVLALIGFGIDLENFFRRNVSCRSNLS
jgi:lipopolysaccharide/colanic/teichoic acid biosynthesis glycosyltransferase